LGLLVFSIFVACGQGESESTPVSKATVVNELNDVNLTDNLDTSSENISSAKGQTLYESTCSACHGGDAKGIEGVGKNLIEGEFVLQISDDDLLDFIKVGREPGDPNNTSGISMPAKGGNPALSDDDIKNIIAHLRSIQ
jgi:disulfide bond formation protein DsbB